jgi:hypothetical protein
LNDDIHKQHASKAIDPKSRPEGHQPDPDAETGMVTDVAAMADKVSPESIHDVVSEHGAAHTVHQFHDHEGGHHHVVSYHGEHKPGKEDGAGFTHHSHHSSHKEAHAHAGQALGMESSEHEAKESPEFETGEHEGAKEAAIPGLS